ncbi:hypothetical protein [Sphingobium sp.]|uniref:hypothetical protein n=1 Tax=Sphingobium sp. TaxID=1912891 RepID=UPI003BB71B87
MWKYIVVPVIATLAVPAIAQAPSRTERIQFARGASSTTLRGTIRGYDSVDYVVGARAGQTMSVTLRTTNRSAYFNVLPGRDEVAIFNGSIGGNQFDGRLKNDGDYRVRVYLMRNAARRGEVAAFSLSVGISGRPGAGGPGSGTAPIGSGPPVSAGNMVAFCRGEASAQYAVRPAYIKVGRVVADRGSGSVIDGSADKGREGIKRFRCRFDGRNRFIDVMAITRDGF